MNIDMYGRYRYGGHITDEELLALLAYFNGIKKSVLGGTFVPPEFQLFVSEVLRIITALESFASNRGLKVPKTHDLVDVSLTKEQAYLIKSLVQNYMNNDPGIETAKEYELRESVFNALPSFEELTK